MADKAPSEILIDRNVMSGRPVMCGTRIPVDILMFRFLSGESLAYVAEDYRISRDRLENLMRELFKEARRIKRKKKLRNGKSGAR